MEGLRQQGRVLRARFFVGLKPHAPTVVLARPPDLVSIRVCTDCLFSAGYGDFYSIACFE